MAEGGARARLLEVQQQVPAPLLRGQHGAQAVLPAPCPPPSSVLHNKPATASCAIQRQVMLHGQHGAQAVLPAPSPPPSSVLHNSSAGLEAPASRLLPIHTYAGGSS